MSALQDRLAAQIAADGPITVAAFMAAALFDPADGYYATRPGLGAEGDFLTAPETSQMFGELIGLWCVHEWGVLGAPNPMQWIEMGPGRGVLMADAWRAAGLSPAFRAAARVTLVEPSAPLRAVQAERLAAASPMQVETLEAAPPGPTLLIANEVLDCLPVRQFVRTPRGWCERMVGLGPDGALTFGLFPAPSEVDAPNLPEGAVFEVAPGLPALIGALAARLHAAPGRALLIDYGYTAQEGADTLQALRRHEKRPPLAEPGEADLTALVDFSAVARLARAAGLRVDGPTPQGAFLHALGIAERAEALARAAPGSRETIARAYNRLTAPDQMGALFQAICLSSPNLPPAAGL